MKHDSSSWYLSRLKKILISWKYMIENVVKICFRKNVLHSRCKVPSEEASWHNSPRKVPPSTVYALSLCQAFVLTS